MTSIQSSPFSYDALDLDTRAFVQQKAREVQARMQRTAADIIAIGQDLLEVKAKLKHGEFQAWIAAECSMSNRTAENFMNAAKRFAGKSEMVSHLPLNVLYTISGSTISDDVAQQVIAGELPAASVRAASRKQNESEEQYTFRYFWAGLDKLIVAWSMSADNKEFMQEAIRAVVAYLPFIEKKMLDSGVGAQEALTIAAQAILESVKRSKG